MMRISIHRRRGRTDAQLRARVEAMEVRLAVLETMVSQPADPHRTDRPRPRRATAEASLSIDQVLPLLPDPSSTDSCRQVSGRDDQWPPERTARRAPGKWPQRGKVRALALGFVSSVVFALKAWLGGTRQVLARSLSETPASGNNPGRDMRPEPSRQLAPARREALPRGRRLPTGTGQTTIPASPLSRFLKRREDNPGLLDESIRHAHPEQRRVGRGG